MCVGVGCFMFWQILPSISLYVWFLKGFDLYYIYIILYIYIYIYIVFIIVFIYCITNTKHWTDKWKYIPYIFVTHKVLKSCRIKMATLAHDVCDVHGASLLYIKTCWQCLYRVFLTGQTGESSHQPKICSFTPSPPNFYSLPPKVNST